MSTEKTSQEEKKVSPYELPEGLGFKAGDTIRLKESPQTEFTILGISNLKTDPDKVFIRIFGEGGNVDITPEQLQDKFEHIPEHSLEDLLE